MASRKTVVRGGAGNPRDEGEKPEGKGVARRARSGAGVGSVRKEAAGKSPAGADGMPRAGWEDTVGDRNTKG